MFHRNCCSRAMTPPPFLPHPIQKVRCPFFLKGCLFLKHCQNCIALTATLHSRKGGVQHRRVAVQEQGEQAKIMLPCPEEVSVSFTEKPFLIPGTVAYNIDGWLFKNKDPLNECVATLMGQSKEKMVASFFPPPEEGQSCISGSEDDFRFPPSWILSRAFHCIANLNHKMTQGKMPQFGTMDTSKRKAPEFLATTKNCSSGMLRKDNA